MKPDRLVIAVVGGALFAVTSFAMDDGTNRSTEIETLEPQMHDLDQKVRILERQLELDQDEARALEKAQPRISLGASGFSLASADSNFVAALHGLLQVDNRENFVNIGSQKSNGILLRRARPVISGTVFRDFDFLFTSELAGSAVQVLDADVNYRCRPELQVQAGKFKPPIGLENLEPEPATLFNERSLVENLLPYRDIGAELHGELSGGAATYAAGIFDGSPDYTTATANSDYDNNQALEGRIFLQPWKNSSVAALQGFGFGVGGSWEDDRAVGTSFTGLTPGYVSDGQRKFFTYINGVAANGQHWRISPQAYYYHGPFGWMAEYAISDQQVSKGPASAELRNQAWEVSGSWVLTGEAASYNGVTPRRAFDPHRGGWGAWQLVVRYAALDVDHAAFPIFANPSASAAAARAWSAGVNWYLNGNLRVNVSFSRTTFSGGNGSGATVNPRPENAFFTRVQWAF